MMPLDESDKTGSTGHMALTSGLPRGARVATSLLFLVDGGGFGAWAGHIPVFQQQFQVSNGTLSIALFALVAGGICAMPAAGQQIARRGSRSISRHSTVVYCLVVPLLALAPSFPLFVLAAALYGASKATIDVALNAQAVTVERAYARPIMSSFQAFWSVGGLAGAAIVSAALRNGFTARENLLCIGCLLLAITLGSRRYIIADPPAERPVQGFIWPSRPLLKLGALAFLVLFGEGAMADWSAVYLRSSLGVAAASAALGYAAYSVAMAIGRFCGDVIVERFGPVLTLRISGLLTAAGLGIALLFHSWAASLAGFIGVGLGLANAVPILFGAGARNSTAGPGPGIAAVTTMGYVGFLAGPPTVGLVAEMTSLRAALSLVCVFGLIVALLARFAKPVEPHAASSQANACAVEAVAR